MEESLQVRGARIICWFIESDCDLISIRTEFAENPKTSVDGTADGKRNFYKSSQSV